MSRKVLVSLLYTLEVALVGLFLVQALRHLPGLLIKRSAAAGLAITPEQGSAAPGQFGAELVFLLLMLALPLLAWRHVHSRMALPVCVTFIAVARALPALGIALSDLVVASAVLGGALSFIVLLLRRRVMHFPQMMLYGFAADQLVRAAGATLAISWTADWHAAQLLLSALAIVVTVLLARRFQEPVLAEVTAQQGLISARGAVGIGALLFLQLTLLSLPNAIAARSGTPLSLIAPLLIAATLLPVLPPLRNLSRALLQAFYGGLRGWLWMALIVLLLLIGLRLEALPAAIALVLLQFALSLMWWWLIRPVEEGERNLTAWLPAAALLVTALLLLVDFHTVASPLNDGAVAIEGATPTLGQRMLLGLRGMGPAILLLAVALTSLPMTRNRQRIAWKRDSAGNGPAALLFFVVAVAAGVALTSGPATPASLDRQTLRVATWNIDGGMDSSLHQDLERIAQTIEASGADVVMLQNVDAGRSSSFWVDQAYWLAHRLRMQHQFFPTAGGINGLAVLARSALPEHDGRLAAGDGRQGGLQRAALDVQGETLTLYNYWPGQAPRGLQLQIGAMNTLIGALHTRDEPERLALAASLTGAPDDALLLPLRAANFIDPFENLAPGFQWTTTLEGEPARSDFLWIRSPLTSEGTGVPEAEGYRHRLVMVEISLAPAAS